jgi:hypothetical protein
LLREKTHRKTAALASNIEGKWKLLGSVVLLAIPDFSAPLMFMVGTAGFAAGALAAFLTELAIS